MPIPDPLRRTGLLPLVLLSLVGCAPRARPLVGVPVAEAVPEAELSGSRRIVFRWRYTDGAIEVQGEGVARVTAPDSARLDFFVDGGLGGGTAFLLGDSLIAPGGAQVRRFLPPVPLLWAALGRLAVPQAADTVVVRDADTVRADVGARDRWRATFVPGGLVRLARIDDQRLVEYVERPPELAAGGELRYRNAVDRRSLTLTLARVERVPGFDDDVWIR